MGCFFCNYGLRVRLRARIRLLENARRGFQCTSVTLRAASTVSKNVPQSMYFDTVRPTVTQTSAASKFFEIHRPRISWVADEWRKHAHSASVASTLTPPKDHNASPLPLLIPEIAFLGRSNTGKSSLLNALLQSPGLCRVGSKPGKTTTMHAWTLSASTKLRSKSKTTSTTNTSDRLTVLDMPGYGHGSHDEWGADIVKYLRRRRQLRRAMVLLNPKHGLKEGDEQILHLLRVNGVPHQIIACKCDTLPIPQLPKRLTQLKEQIRISEQKSSTQGSTLCIDDLLVVGKVGDGKMNKMHNLQSAFGVDDVQWAILQAVGLDEFAVQQQNKLRQQEISQLRRDSEKGGQTLQAAT